MSDAATTLQAGGLDRIYDGIESVLPGVMHTVVQMALFDTIEEFCMRSTYWRGLFAWSMEPGQTTLDLNPPGASPLVRWVLEVRGLRCHRIAPTAVLIDTSGTLDTSVARSGTVWAACTPTQLENLPDWINDWTEGLRAGALFRLYSHPKKPYSDARQAPSYGKLFRSQIQLAKVEAQKLCSRDAWHFPYFARGREGFWGGWGRGWGDVCCGPDGQVLDTRSGLSGAAYTLSAITLTFPTVPEATASADETITITNTGTVPLVITGTMVTGDFALTGLTLP